MKSKLTRYILSTLLAAALLPGISKANLTRSHIADTIIAKNSIPSGPADIRPLLIGESIPPVVIPDANGNPYNLNSKLSEKPTILIFYRGGWCPFCNKQLEICRKFRTSWLKWVIN